MLFRSLRLFMVGAHDFYRIFTYDKTTTGGKVEIYIIVQKSFLMLATATWT